MPFRRLAAEDASWGRVVRRLERCDEEDTKAVVERAERDWRERRVEWEDWARDWGSDVVSEAKGRVERRVRYLDVMLSWTLVTGRGEAGVSKYGARSSYNGSAMILDDRPQGADRN